MTKKMLAAVACLGAAIGSAQTMTMEPVRVTLPYATKAGNVTLPAGEYSIRELKNSVLEISSEAHRGTNTFVMFNEITAPNGAAADHTKVILRHDANGYQIQSIWLQGQEIGFELTSAE
jgi:hypothetical protein